jgi:hypothetical protein
MYFPVGSVSFPAQTFEPSDTIVVVSPAAGE